MTRAALKPEEDELPSVTSMEGVAFDLLVFVEGYRELRAHCRRLYDENQKLREQLSLRRAPRRKRK